MSPARTVWLFVFALAILFVAGSITATAQIATAERENKASVKVRKATPQEVKALSDAMAASTSEEDSDLVIVKHKNGMQSVDLKGRFQSLAVAKRNSDGSVAVKCVDSAEEGSKFLTTNERAPQKQAKQKKTEAEVR
jgi:hypothetical protein